MSAHAARRSPSTWRNHPSSWFQLAKLRLAKVSAHCLPFGLDEIHGATVSGDQMWVTGRTRSIRFPRGWEEMPGLTAGFDRPFVARLAPMRRAIEAAWLLTPHVGRGNAIAIRAEGMVFASGETTDAGNRFRVRDGSNIAPTAGAFSVGAQWAVPIHMSSLSGGSQ